MAQPRALDDLTAKAVLTVMLAGVVPALVVGGLAFVVHPLAGVALALLVAAAWAVFVRVRIAGAAGRLLGPLGATPLAPGSEPRLENLLEGVCVVSGIDEPRILVLRDDTLNALAVADSSGTFFVVTRGLIDGLGRVELEGVLANLATRVRTGAARYGATVLALPAPASYLGKLLHDGFGDRSSVRSDLEAVGLTRYPPGLISALEVMGERGTAVGGAPASTAPLWLAEPSAGAASSAWDSTDQQPLSLRIAVLQEL